MTLDQLKPGKTATIDHLTGTGAVTQRLLEMGMVPGVQVTVVRLAPLGDPMQIQVDGYNLSLRKSEASLVVVGSVT